MDHDVFEVKLSVILPVYNVERFVEKCVLSLEAQDLDRDQYEIIAVNDGSPDRSQEVIESLMKRFENIVLVKQENQGVSIARNNGLKAARGTYVMFLDPDDYFEENCLGTLIREMEESPGRDVMMVALKEVNMDGDVTYVDSVTPSRTGISGIELYRNFRKVRGETGVDTSCGLVIRREFLLRHNLFYLEGVPYLEDGEYLARMFCLAGECSFVSAPYYNRVIRPGSATNSNLFFADKSVFGFVRAARNLLEFKANSHLDEAKRNFINQPIVKFCLLAVQSCVSRNGYKNIVKVRRMLATNGLRKLEVKGCNPFYARYASIYNASVYLFFVAWVLRATRISSLNRLKRLALHFY